MPWTGGSRGALYSTWLEPDQWRAFVSWIRVVFRRATAVPRAVVIGPEGGSRGSWAARRGRYPLRVRPECPARWGSWPRDDAWPFGPGVARPASVRQECVGSMSTCAGNDPGHPDVRRPDLNGVRAWGGRGCCARLLARPAPVHARPKRPRLRFASRRPTTVRVRGDGSSGISRRTRSMRTGPHAQVRSTHSGSCSIAVTATTVDWNPSRARGKASSGGSHTGRVSASGTLAGAAGSPGRCGLCPHLRRMDVGRLRVHPVAATSGVLPGVGGWTDCSRGRPIPRPKGGLWTLFHVKHLAAGCMGAGGSRVRSAGQGAGEGCATWRPTPAVPGVPVSSAGVSCLATDSGPVVGRGPWRCRH